MYYYIYVLHMYYLYLYKLYIKYTTAIKKKVLYLYTIYIYIKHIYIYENLKLFYIMWCPSDKMVSVLLHVHVHQTVEPLRQT